MLAPEVIAQAEKRIGLTIGGKWHLDRVIGVGGMAAVYEATHRNRNRVAIKLLHPILSLDEGTRHRFLREGYVANTIRHEGAVQVLDDDLTEEGIAFLVMELLRGETVEDRMDRKGGALEIPEALDLTEQLLDVLCAAHDQGVVHRDIKPDNLFLTDDGRLKVLDFGIARLHQGDTRSTRAGSFMGTPAYCAPEQARGRWDEVDARTDLFSVAATLFTAITGSHVHPAETSSEQLALAIGATARSLSDAFPQAPTELVQFVDRALAYNKDDRFQSARAMKAAIQKVRAGLKDAPTRLPSRSLGGDAPTLYRHDEGTLGAELDSFSPNPVFLNKPPARILVGVLAAGVLATFVLIALQKNESQLVGQARQAEPATAAARTSAQSTTHNNPENNLPATNVAPLPSLPVQTDPPDLSVATDAARPTDPRHVGHSNSPVATPPRPQLATQASAKVGIAPSASSPASSPPVAAPPGSQGATNHPPPSPSDDAIFGSRF